MTPKHVDINVRGIDMFGACFSESAKLMSVADSELSVFMWRPVAEGAEVELNCDNESYSLKGQIVRNEYHACSGAAVKCL